MNYSYYCVFCPFDSNVIDKIQEKHTKYADLAYEMSRLHPKYKVIRLPIILGALVWYRLIS